MFFPNLCVTSVVIDWVYFEFLTEKKKKKRLPRPGIVQSSYELSGFEPGTFRSSVWRSPNWAISAVEYVEVIFA